MFSTLMPLVLDEDKIQLWRPLGLLDTLGASFVVLENMISGVAPNVKLVALRVPKGGKKSGVFMVSEVENDEPQQCEVAFSLMPTAHAFQAAVRQPELEGYAVLDTGATETVGSLEALEMVVGAIWRWPSLPCGARSPQEFSFWKW